MKEQKMTDEQLSQELNKSKGGRIGGKILSLLGLSLIHILQLKQINRELILRSSREQSMKVSIFR